MKVRAIRTGFFGGRRRPGTVFDVPEGSTGSWFVPVEVPEEQAPTIDEAVAPRRVGRPKRGEAVQSVDTERATIDAEEG